ncbi:MAG: glutaminyl-peptide cyclotransferase [Candidatus Delongbacteria bacterium]|nr:glutaminyl-peptide cyclotransferase [Candidatus Delongbacteria bacterium]
MKKLCFYILILLSLTSCYKNDNSGENEIEIINIYSHDTSYFTQGFEFKGDTLVEGTGQYGRSKIVRYNIADGTVYDQVALSSDYFGEGITVLSGKIYQLTWHAGKCFVYDEKDLSGIREFSYYGQGWGLTNDGENLIMSNGSSTIFFRDPEDFSILRTISVKDSDGNYIIELNELEYADGLIYANIWGTDRIISVDPVSGMVEDDYNLSALKQQAVEKNPNSDVLNGIAYKDSSFFVTGKYWPYIFEIGFSKKTGISE